MIRLLLSEILQVFKMWNFNVVEKIAYVQQQQIIVFEVQLQRRGKQKDTMRITQKVGRLFKTLKTDLSCYWWAVESDS
jgi:hypothetical protein